MKGIDLAAGLDLADPCRLLEPARRAVQATSAAILKTYATDVTALSKDDGSPVTEADEWAEAMILAALAELTLSIPLIAEDQAAAHGLTVLTAAGDRVETLDGDRRRYRTPRSRNPRFIARGAIG
jgi:3'(2'), 5'-bisphosphate nucleotidase